MTGLNIADAGELCGSRFSDGFRSGRSSSSWQATRSCGLRAFSKDDSVTSLGRAG